MISRFAVSQTGLGRCQRMARSGSRRELELLLSQQTRGQVRGDYHASTMAGSHRLSHLKFGFPQIILRPSGNRWISSHIRALRRETAVKGQGLSCVIG